ncbi:MAG: alpha/beta hydrolase [Actinomycetales bacterium]|nr:alpha/beta hydrolase [Actinomycetales bacterium]
MVNLQVLSALGRLARTSPLPEPLPAGDWQGRRASMAAVDEAVASAMPMPADVRIAPITLMGAAGHRITGRLYRSEGADARACVVYVHGGGMIMGTLDGYDRRCARYASLAGVPVIAVDYRLAPEHPFPAAVDDVTDAVHWVASRADDIGIDPGRIAIAGDSAGGGIAAGVTLRLRDEGGPALAGQLLVYPMLDDRTPAPARPSRLLTWTAADNATGWGALLGERAGGPDVSPYAAPARAADLSGLPRAFVEGCTLDLFMDEDEAYAHRLAAAGVQVDWRVRRGVPHGFDVLAPRAWISRRAWRERAAFLRDCLQVADRSVPRGR